MDVNGASAIVTGGASGLGEATVRLLAAAGAKVVIADFNTESGQRLAAEIGENATAVSTDVTDDDQVAAALAVAADLGPLRVAVNCAGMGAGIRTIDRNGKPHSRKVWKRVVDLNLTGTFYVMSRAAELMSETELPPSSTTRGVIVNTASIAAFDGQIGQLAYAASKAAVVGMTLVAARDLGLSGIRVCTIAPGLMDTPMLAGLGDEGRAKLGEQVVGPRRLGRPDEYAAIGPGDH